MIVREATREDIPSIARVHVDTWKATYRGIVPDSFLDSLTYESRAERWEDTFPGPGSDRFMYVAEVGGEIAGFATGGPPDPPRVGYDGELYAIYIAPEHQGKGLGRTLVQTVARRLHEGGAATMTLWTFRSNDRARRFYESLGGEVLGEKTFEIHGETMHDLAYGWPDITVLLGDQQEERQWQTTPSRS